MLYLNTLLSFLDKSRIAHNNKAIICPKTNRFPFICHNCTKKYNCNMRKYYYNYKTANDIYLRTMSNSRWGIDIDIDQIGYWNDYFRDKLKTKNQPITKDNVIKQERKYSDFEKYIKNHPKRSYL